MDVFQKLLQIPDEVVLFLLIAANQTILIGEALSEVKDESMAICITIIMLLLTSGLYTMVVIQRRRLANPYIICTNILFILVAQTELNSKTSLVLIQLILTDIYIKKLIQLFKQYLINKTPTFLLLSMFSFIYVYVRLYSHFADNLEFVMSILFILLLKILHMREYLQTQRHISTCLQESAQSQQHLNYNLEPEPSVPSPRLAHVPKTNSNENNSFYKAFDILPEGIIILNKNSDSEFQSLYANKALQLIFGNEAYQDILPILETLNSEKKQRQSLKAQPELQQMQSMASYQSASLKKSTKTIQFFKYAAQFVSITDDMFNPSIMLPVQDVNSDQVQVHAPKISLGNFAVERTPSDENSNSQQTPQLRNREASDQSFCSKNKHTSMPHHNEPRHSTNTFNLSRKVIGQRQNSNLKSPTSTIKYIQIERKSIELVQLQDLMEQIWDQTIALYKENKIPLKKDRQLFYILESEMFVTSTNGEKPKYLDIKVFSASSNGEPVLLVIVRDVTHRDYIRSLRSHNQQKSQTLNFVSHEFRTPLNCIINMLETLIEKGSIADNDDLVLIQSALANSEYCLNLAQDLLDLAQLKSGKFQININRFNLKDTLQQCLNMFSIQAQKQQIALYLEFDADISAWIYSDKKRIRQVTINLLANALKFTLKGSVVIRCTIDERDYIVIEVEDTGIGVKPEDQPKLFKAFGKIKNKENQRLNEQGVGLGLIISHQICQQLSDNHSGLGFSSEYGIGTIFCFKIKNHDIQSQIGSYEDIKAESLDCDTMIGEKMLKLKNQLVNSKFMIQKSLGPILIVDDNQFNIEALKFLIQRSYPNIQCDYTISGYLAETKCQENLSTIPYKLIFMDVEMPYQNGIITSKHIKEIYKKANQTVKIVGCSGYVSQREREMCLLQMDDYLVKPVKKDMLDKVINYAYL